MWGKLWSIVGWDIGWDTCKFTKAVPMQQIFWSGYEREMDLGCCGGVIISVWVSSWSPHRCFTLPRLFLPNEFSISVPEANSECETLHWIAEGGVPDPVSESCLLLNTRERFTLLSDWIWIMNMERPKIVISEASLLELITKIVLTFPLLE